MNEKEDFFNGEVGDWIPVFQPPKRPDLYQVFYGGDPEDRPSSFYTFRYWNGSHWYVITTEGKKEPSSFGNHGRTDTGEFWRDVRRMK